MREMDGYGSGWAGAVSCPEDKHNQSRMPSCTATLCAVFVQKKFDALSS